MSAGHAEDMGAPRKAYPKNHPSREDKAKGKYLEEYVRP